MDRRSLAFLKLMARRSDLPALREERHHVPVVIERRFMGGKLRIVKSYQGDLLPIQATEFKLLSHHKLPKEFRHLVQYTQGTNMVGPEIVMRDCGLDLDDWQLLLNSDRASPMQDFDVLLAVWRQVLQLLRQIHAAGFVHCDIKPDNICVPLANRNIVETEGLISGTWDVSSMSLIDFGLALQPVDGLDPRGCYVDRGYPLIRPHGPYMSPLYTDRIFEAQRLFLASGGTARGHPPWLSVLNQIDWRVDLFSLGCMLRKQFEAWEVQAGRKPTSARREGISQIAAELLRMGSTPSGEQNLPHDQFIQQIEQLMEMDVGPIQVQVRNPESTSTRTVPVTAGGNPMEYAIDGSNALLNLIVDGKPSVRAFARLLILLEERGHPFRLFFDNSITNRMNEKGVGDDWLRLRAALQNAGIKPHYAPRADGPIEELCAQNGAALINAHDKIDSWRRKPKIIHRARVGRIKNKLQVELRDSRGQFVLTAPLGEPFAFGGMAFAPVGATEVTLETRLNRDELAPSLAEATLLVFALDASGSMLQPAHDGRTKSEVLNTLMIQTFDRLRKSRIGEALYIGVLTFTDDVTPISCPETGDAGFSSAATWADSGKSFDYMANVTPGLTNIRLALQRSKELIQDALFEGDTASEITDRWRAVIILVTDGIHAVRRTDGQPEADSDVVDELIDLDTGVGALIGSRIDVGCVGIGLDQNSDLLSKVASACTPKQRQIARISRVDDLLVNNSLFIKVDANDKRYEEAIRSFIDVVSGSR